MLRLTYKITLQPMQGVVDDDLSVPRSWQYSGRVKAMKEDIQTAGATGMADSLMIGDNEAFCIICRDLVVHQITHFTWTPTTKQQSVEKTEDVSTKALTSVHVCVDP